jgi:hypothetical protein
LCARSGKSNSHDAQVVYERDAFDYEQGSNPFIQFKRVLVGDRGKPYCAFCVIFMKEGPARFEIMDMFELAKIESCARGTDREDSPWKKWKAEMWRKSPVRRLAKYVSLSDETQRAATIDESNELGYSRFDEASGAYILDPAKEKPEPIQQPEPVKNGAYAVADKPKEERPTPPAAAAPPVRERTIDTSETQEPPNPYNKDTKKGIHVSDGQVNKLWYVLHAAQKRGDRVPSDDEFLAKLKSMGYKDARYIPFKPRTVFDEILKWVDGGLEPNNASNDKDW